jgi:hypothetical protein
MTRKLVTLCWAALAMLLVSSVLAPADARRGGHGGHGGHGHGGHGHAGHGHGGHGHAGHGHRSHSFGHVHRFHRHGHLFSAPFVYGYYSYDDGCYWLRRRALYTGSSYWWNRYYACIYGDY